MRLRLADLSLNRRLALLAFGFGSLALFARPLRGNVVTLDLKDLATVIDLEHDHVTPGELAGWIVAGRSDFRLIDLRGETQYGQYHIPTAENVALSVLPDSSIQPTEKVVLYSEGSIHASQAWMLMRAKGLKNVYTLKGGLDQWKDDVLFPTLADDATPQEKARFEATAALARFFGGSPRTGGPEAAVAQPPEMPKVEAPVTAGSAPGPLKRKKKKEGC